MHICINLNILNKILSIFKHNGKVTNTSSEESTTWNILPPIYWNSAAKISQPGKRITEGLPPKKFPENGISK
jgi:hypothetical protein